MVGPFRLREPAVDEIATLQTDRAGLYQQPAWA
jgi:hypothetical protein